MMKKLQVAGFLLFLSVMVNAQNEMGAYLFPQWSSINNKGNDEPIYQHIPTVSAGGGGFFVHYFEGLKISKARVRFGYSKPRLGLRLDLAYSAHNQKFKSEYRVGEEIRTHFGKKRLDYLKLAVMAEYTRPLNRHMNVVIYGGPQLSYLLKADGGIVAYRRYSTFDYYDLPVADKAYFKTFLFDLTASIGVDYKVTKWVNIFAAIRGDWSVTGVENKNAEANGIGVYNLEGNDDRSNSHNTGLSLTVGVEYKLHRPEHARTKY